MYIRLFFIHTPKPSILIYFLAIYIQCSTLLCSRNIINECENNEKNIFYKKELLNLKKKRNTSYKHIYNQMIYYIDIVIYTSTHIMFVYSHIRCTYM